MGQRYGCRHHQPSASNMLMSQPIGPNHPSVQAEHKFVSEATSLTELLHWLDPRQRSLGSLLIYEKHVETLTLFYRHITYCCAHTNQNVDDMLTLYS